MNKIDIIFLFHKWDFDYQKHKEEICRIGDLTAIRKLKGKIYRRNYERALLLLGLAKTYNLRKILEFGTGRGFVTATLASMDLVVYTVDNQSTETAKKLIDQLEIYNQNIVFIGIDSHKLKSSSLPWDFDLVFIDGGHDYASVKNDFNLAKQCCKRGFIVFDDFRNKHREIKKFIKEIKMKKTLVNTDGWIFKNELIHKAGDADGLINGKETKSGQVIIPIQREFIR